MINKFDLDLHAAYGVYQSVIGEKKMRNFVLQYSTTNIK